MTTAFIPDTPLPAGAELFWGGRAGDPPSGFSVVREPMGKFRIETVGEFGPRRAYVLFGDDVLSPAEAGKVALALLAARDEVEQLDAGWAPKA